MSRRLVAALATTAAILATVVGPTLGARAQSGGGADRVEGAVVTGRVVDERGRPVRGVGVEVIAHTGRSVLGTDGAAVFTGIDGRYAVRDVEPGTYRVVFAAPDDTYVDRVWPGVPRTDLAGSVEVDLAAGARVSGIDAVLPVGGVVTGATDLRDGTTVMLYRGEATASEPVELRRVADGRFLVGGLDTGRYRLCFAPLRFGGGGSQWCAGGPDPTSAATIAVTRGRVVARDVVFGEPASVAADVTTSFTSDDDLDDAATTMTAYRRTPDGFRRFDDAPVDSFDRAATSLPAGTYRFAFVGADTQEFWPDAHSLDDAADVVLLPGASVDLDVVLDRGAEVAGRFHADGDGLGAPVTAYRRGADGGWHPVSTHVLGEPGGYRIAGLRPGTYRLGFGADAPWFAATVPVYWPASPTLAGAQDIVVTGRDQVVEGKDVDVDPGSVIVGRASTPGLPELSAGDVVAYRLVAGRWVEERRGGPVPRLDGRFSLAGLPAGTYRVAHVPAGGGRLPTFHGPGSPRRITDATDVVLAADQLVEGVDVRVLGEVRNVERPRVVGPARVGARLRSVIGTWSPTATRLARQWYVGGRAVRGATGPSYVVRRGDRGRQVSLAVTGIRGDGWRPLVVRSAPTTRIRAR